MDIVYIYIYITEMSKLMEKMNLVKLSQLNSLKLKVKIINLTD